jgi:hypothetical protein
LLDYPCRDASNGRIRWHTLRHDTTGTYDRITPDPDAVEDSRARTYPDMVIDFDTLGGNARLM